MVCSEKMRRNGASISNVRKGRKGMARVYWSMIEVFTHRLTTDVLMARTEVRGTGSDGRALMQYQAAMVGSSKFANMV